MKNRIILLILTIILLAFTWVSAAEDIAKELTENIVRLHILANSNAPQDQELKLKIRDRLLHESQQAPHLLSDEEILAFCRDEIKKQGSLYPVSIQRGIFFFPAKTYDNLRLPAGQYHALRISIGEGEGENWWCVMYPPLCFNGKTMGTMNETALQQLQSMVSQEAFTLICESDHITIKPSFKLLELWQALKSSWQT